MQHQNRVEKGVIALLSSFFSGDGGDREISDKISEIFCRPDLFMFRKMRHEEYMHVDFFFMKSWIETE